LSSYALPGSILAGAVGGTAAVATLATLVRPRLAGRASTVAGLVLAGWIVGEVLILTADGELVSLTEVVYLAAAAAMVGLGRSFDRSARGQAATVATTLSRWDRFVLLVEGGLDRRLGPLGVWVYRRTKGGIARPWKVDALLLTTRGRRSGKQRTVVLRYFPDGQSMMVVAANDGGARYPGWYHNLRADPTARVEAYGHALAVRAEELSPAESVAYWPRIVEQQPAYERFRRATDRPFPVIRLVPTAAAG
jgi:deazaflavin-dependent oxidoreductase (nitroreductase family)